MLTREPMHAQELQTNEQLHFLSILIRVSPASRLLGCGYPWHLRAIYAHLQRQKGGRCMIGRKYSGTSVHDQTLPCEAYITAKQDTLPTSHSNYHRLGKSAMNLLCAAPKDQILPHYTTTYSRHSNESSELSLICERLSIAPGMQRRMLISDCKPVVTSLFTRQSIGCERKATTQSLRLASPHS